MAFFLADIEVESIKAIREAIVWLVPYSISIMHYYITVMVYIGIIGWLLNSKSITKALI